VHIARDFPIIVVQHGFGIQRTKIDALSRLPRRSARKRPRHRLIDYHRVLLLEIVLGEKDVPRAAEFSTRKNNPSSPYETPLWAAPPLGGIGCPSTMNREAWRNSVPKGKSSMPPTSFDARYRPDLFGDSLELAGFASARSFSCSSGEKLVELRKRDSRPLDLPSPIHGPAGNPGSTFQHVLKTTQQQSCSNQRHQPPSQFQKLPAGL